VALPPVGALLLANLEETQMSSEPVDNEHSFEQTAPVPGNEDAPVSDLVGRLDALVQCYSTDHAQRAVPAANAVETNVPAGEHSSQPRSRQQSRQIPSHRELPEELKAAKIMVVDDEEGTILTVQHHLKKEGYENFIFTTKPREAIELLRREEPDVVLLDIRMPEVSGLDILRVKELDPSLEHIPVIVLTATTDPITKRSALDLGATDFLTKPVDPNDLAPRVRNSLVAKKHYDQKANEAARLEDVVRHRTAEVVQSRQQLILSLARAAEHRDNETGNHVLRVGRFAGVIARELGWSESQAEIIEQAAPLHDVGKIGVPDSILFKPGKLDPQEFDLIRKHCTWGKQIIEPFSGRELHLIQAHSRLGESILHVRNSPMLMMASRIAQTHHESWDGSGYPLGLAGEDIPLEGRITAVADVYDALSSKRPYKFDPWVLDAFFARASEIVAIQMELCDPCPVQR
jgi:putative two-component system response regulator